MKWFQSRKIACLICVCTISLASLIRSQVTFAGFYKDAQSVFMNGIYADGYSIQNDCEKKTATANNLLTIAKKYLKNDASVMQGVEANIQAFKNSETIEEKAKAMNHLDLSFDQLLKALYECELSEKDDDYLIVLTADYDALSDMIERNGYHEFVDFQIKSTESFPASLFYRLSNKHLMRFEGGQK